MITCKSHKQELRKSGNKRDHCKWHNLSAQHEQETFWYEEQSWPLPCLWIWMMKYSVRKRKQSVKSRKQVFQWEHKLLTGGGLLTEWRIKSHSMLVAELHQTTNRMRKVEKQMRKRMIYTQQRNRINSFIFSTIYVPQVETLIGGELKRDKIRGEETWS